MVRTRHSGDHEDESPRKFISLAQEKGKFLSKCGERSHAHDDDLDDYNIFEEKVVDSRLRPRTGPRRAYNYLDADSSDDEVQMRIRQSSSQNLNGKLLRSCQMKDDMMDEQQSYERSSKSKRLTIDEADDEDGNISTRRSMRNRRPIYDTLNQSFLVNGERKENRGTDMTMNNRKNDSNDEPKDQESDEDAKEQETEDNLEFSDMYSRVKRKRIRVKRNMYGMPMNDSDSDSEQDEENCNNNKRINDVTEDDDDEDEKDKESSGVSTRRKSQERNLRKRIPEQTVKSYSLREHKPRTVLYKAPVEEKRHRKIHHGLFDVTPTKNTSGQTYQSPALRRNFKKRSAIHSSSTTSSSDSESNDEKNFRRRKAKSMAKARGRMMPMNFSNSTPPSNIVKDRVKSGASLADVEPMNIDKNITFDSIGGLGKHIRALKEMVVFPLLYDKVFQRFKVDPPRGVLFYGPPGTGKTLVARALANECSHGDKRVAFFMRKGADCLSKWVGESERQLRLLFDQAYKFRPSIIFFDEIDGLAPVRSSRQDQIHSSIVSTLLALMDGLDSRGEIVVIGATNRIDSLDPALRRPGRFDREFLFPLPSLEARKHILKIQTSCWNPLLNDAFIGELAEKCVGYCGADLKALCTEAAMLALRRRYPQIYISNEALQLDESSINVSAKDFFDAIGNIIPTSQRACDTPARALSMQVRPLLERQLNKIMDQLGDTFPLCLSKMSSLDVAATSSQIKALAESGAVWDELASDEDEDAPSIFVSPHAKGSKHKGHPSTEGGPSTSFAPNTYLNFSSFATSRPATFRPRLLLTGHPGQGQTSYLAPAVIHKMEDMPVHVLDLPALYAVTAKTPEESCANVFHEAKRKTPSIIYLPYINQWWDVMGDTLRATLLTLIHDLNPSMPLLLLATSELSYKELDPVLRSLFNHFSGEVITMTNPNAEERRTFFKDLVLRHSCKSPPQKKQAGDIFKLLKRSKGAKSRCAKFKQSFLRHKDNFAKQKKGKNVLKSNTHEHFHKFNCSNMETNMLLPGEVVPSAKQINAVFEFTCGDPAVRCAPKSIHRMVLRPRGNYSRLNQNHSARRNRKSKACHIFKSTKSGICDSVRRKGFKKHRLMHSLRFPDTFLLKGATYQPSKNFRFSYEKSIMNQSRFKGSVNEVGSSGVNKSFAASGRLSHVHLSSRQLHYLHRHQEHVSPLVSVTPDSHLGQNNKRNRWKSRIVRSFLSCGSSQMLYETDDKQPRHSLMRNESFLPINFRPGSTVPQQRENRKFHRLVRFQKLRSPRPRRVLYNLRPRSKHTTKVCRAKRMLEVLPKAAPVKPRELTDEELQQLVEKEELTLMELRIFLRDVLNKLGSDKKFSIFAKPVNIEDAPDYLEIIESPMDLSTMMSKIDLHEYTTVHSFIDDIDLICSNALEYNPNRGPMDRIIRHRACALKDTAYAIIKTELDKDFEKLCLEIEESRNRRGVKSSSVPKYYRTKSASRNEETSKSQSTIPSYLHQNRPPRSIPKPEGERFSRRVRGLNIDPVPDLEDVEKTGRLARASNSPVQDGDKSPSKIISKEPENTIQETMKAGKNDGSTQNDTKLKSPASVSKSCDSDVGKSNSSNSKVLSRKKSTKCIWCKPRRKRRRLIFTQSSAIKISGEDDVEEEISQENEDDETEGENSGSSYNQVLRVDVSDNLIETDDSKGTTRKSPRALGSPMGVVTRRQSLSPHTIQSNVRKAPDKEMGNSNTDQVTSNGSPEISLETQSQQKLLLPKESSTTDMCGSNSHLIALNKKLRDSLMHSSLPNKASVVKRLDLDSAIVDSGAGSSLESNGDSRDSTDHKLERNSASKNNPETADISNNCNLTLAKQASSVLVEQSQKLEVPMEKLTSLLSRLVHRTEEYNVDRLEKIYSCLSQVIYRHRHSYNRTNMVLEMERRVDELTVFHDRSSSVNHSLF